MPGIPKLSRKLNTLEFEAPGPANPEPSRLSLKPEIFQSSGLVYPSFVHLSTDFVIYIYRFHRKETVLHVRSLLPLQPTPYTRNPQLLIPKRHRNAFRIFCSRLEVSSEPRPR